MNRDNAQLVAAIVDRIDKLENTIFELQQLMSKNSFTIIGRTGRENYSDEIYVELKPDEIATVVFAQDVVQLYIDTLNLELDELVKKLEEF